MSGGHFTKLFPVNMAAMQGLRPSEADAEKNLQTLKRLAHKGKRFSK